MMKKVLQCIKPKYFMMNCKYIMPGLSYEVYLIEVLNHSLFFRNKSRDGSAYIAPKEQSNGEHDAYSTGYCIDFKLLVDEDVMRALRKNMPTVNKKYINQGIIFVHDNPTPTNVPNKNILSVIEQITLEEINKGVFTNKTAKHFINNLEKDKNLFLYYPYEYIGDNVFSVSVFAYMLTQIFRIPLLYREQNYPERDTFICIKVNEHFLIFQWLEQGFVYRDCVNEYLCSIYRECKLYSLF